MDEFFEEWDTMRARYDTFDQAMQAYQTYQLHRIASALEFIAHLAHGELEEVHDDAGSTDP